MAGQYLARGMTGEGVIQLQNDLWALGFNINPDGSFGAETYKAVKDFQYTWGSLTIDGVVGVQTAAAIQEAINLLNQGQWDPGMIMTAPAPVQASTTAQPPRIQSQATTIATQPYELPSPSSLPIIGEMIPPGIDWKWIGLGVLAVVGIVYYMRDR